MFREERQTLPEGNASIGVMANGEEFSSGLLTRSAKLLDKVVFFCLLGLIVTTSIPYGTVEPWWEAVFECAVFAVTAVWIIKVLVQGRWEVRGLFILLPLILITLYAFAQTVEWPAAWPHSLTIDRYQTFLTARKSLALTLFLGLLLLHTSTPKRLRWLVRVVIGLGLACALFGLIRQLFQTTDGFVLPYLFLGSGYGQFIYHNAFSYLMEMVFALLAGLVLGGGVPRDRALIYVAIALFVWTAFIFSNSRGGIISFMCQSIFLSFVSLTWYSARRALRPEGRRRAWLNFFWTSVVLRASVILLIVGALTTSVLWMGGEKLLDRLKEEQEFRQDGPEKARRVDLWSDTWRLIKKNPWTGVGFGSYFLAIPQYQTVSGKLKFEQAHNDYLDLAANGGVVAVGLAGWFMFMVIRRARYSLGSVDAYRRAACLGAAAGILDICVHSVLDFCLQVTSIAVVFGALVVIVVADRRVEAPLDERKRKQTGAQNGLYSSRIGPS